MCRGDDVITEVKLKNWRSHSNSQLQFSQGTNALLGHMGSGKTTILDAICFAFFGTFPSLQSRKMKLDDLVMNKPSIKDVAEVEVSFQINGKNFSIKRIVEKRKGTTYSEIRENGKLLEAPSTQRVNEMIEGILKIDYELFNKAIYSEQNALDYFLTIPKGHRMKKIDELLMIERFEAARSGSITVVNKLSERKSAKQGAVDRLDLNEMQNTIRMLQNSLENLVSEKSNFDNEVNEITRQRSLMENELNILQKMRDDYETMKREENGYTGALEELLKSMEKIESALAEVDKESISENLTSTARFLGNAMGVMEEKRNEEQKSMGKFSRLVADAGFYKKEIERLNADLENRAKSQREADALQKKAGKSPEKDIEKKKRVIEECVGKLESVRIKINDLNETVEQISSIKAKCPVCDTKLTEEKKIILIKEKKRDIEDLKHEFRDALQKKELTEKEMKELEFYLVRLNELLVAVKDSDKLKSEADSHKSALKILMDNTKKQEKELSDLQKSMFEMQSKINDAQTQKQKLELLSHYLREYEGSRTRITDITQQRNRILLHIQKAESSFAGKDLYKMENELRSLIGKEKELSAKKENSDNLIRERENRLRELESVFANAKKEKDEIKRLDDLILQLKLFEKALVATQIQLRQEFVMAVNYSMTQLWKVLYPYQDFPDIRLNVEEGDYVLQLRTLGGEWVNADGIVSGGERSLAALALRIAFSLVLAPHLPILFLDEPTANLDSAAIKVLSDTLREKIGEFVEQTFIITHTPELEEAVTGFAYKLERDKSRDGYAQVVQLN